MTDQTKARVQQYARASTYEISCLTNMANVAREMSEAGVAIPPGTMFSIVDKSTDPGTKDTDRVKTIERSAQLVKLGFRPIPHLAARRYRGAEQLRGIVRALLDVGSRRSRIGHSRTRPTVIAIPPPRSISSRG
jgi:hypothetical protein